MNFRKKVDFLDQGYIKEYIEELYSKEKIRISLNCKDNKVWVEINDVRIERLKENQGKKIIKITQFIESLNEVDCSTDAKIDASFRLKLLDQLYKDLIV